MENLEGLLTNLEEALEEIFEKGTAGNIVSRNMTVVDLQKSPCIV